MKKLLSKVLAASFILASASQLTAAAEDEIFTDISDPLYSWAKTAIVQMAEEGYIAGYEDNTFRPAKEVTRLETIVLFARAMGAVRVENKEVVEIAKEQYQDMIDNLDINFGEDEIAFMLYRGVLTEDDLDTFLTDGKANEPMQRQEAAAIITKAMCADEIATSEVLIDLEYTDAAEIDSDYSQYVYYVSEQGIMKGMDDGYFSPATSVLRSQMAVMLSRVVDAMNLYIETPLVSEINTSKNNITIIDEEGGEVSVGYTDYTKFYIENELSAEKYMEVNVTARLTYINNELVFVDMLDAVVDETKKAVFSGYTSKNGFVVMTVYEPADEEERSELEVSLYAKYFNQEGTKISINDLKPGAYIEFDITNGKVIEIRQLKKDTYILDAIVKSVSIEDELYLTISHKDEEHDGKKFVLTDAVKVYKNDDVEDLSKVYRGDRVELTMQYGIVTKIKAKSDTRTYEGSISEVVISSQPVLRAKINGEIQEFDIHKDAVIKANGEEASIYDLRVGDSVRITTESGVVLTITTVAAAVSSNPITGVVETVNTSMGFIKVDGETIFCKDSITTFISSNGSDKAMRDIKEGSTVSVRGSMSNGAYTASLIIIED